MRDINKIIVHCTATPEGRKTSVADIRSWHKERGWSDIGYHYVVQLDGTVNEGRSVEIAGAHVKGQNTNSIGITYVGGVDKYSLTPKDTRTKEQKESLLKMLDYLKTLYPKATIHGHNEFASKACPCFDAKKEYKHISDQYIKK